MGAIEVAQLIRHARTEGAHAQSMKALADAAGVGLGTVSRLENAAISDPSPNTLRRLSGPLGLPYTSLLRAAGYL